MGDSSSDFREAMVRLIETTAPEPLEHPGVERWMAFHRGELDAREEALLEAHLVRCRDCFDLLEAVDAFSAAPEAADTGRGTSPAALAETAVTPENPETPETPEDTARSAMAATGEAALWRLLRQRLAAPAAPSGPVAALPGVGQEDPPHPPPDQRPFPPASPPPVPPLSAVRPRRSPVPLSHALAAALALGVVGLSLWSVRQQRVLSNLRAPRADAQVLEFSGGARGREAGAASRSGCLGPCLLVFYPAVDAERFRLVIHDLAGGREVLARDLRRDPDFSLTLLLPEGLPRPGRYRLDLSVVAGGAGGEKGEVFASYGLRVPEPPPAR